MEDMIPVKVECHAGYKADEYPKSVYLGGQRFGITEIEDRWHQGDLNPGWPAADYFRVVTDNGERIILKHEIKTDAWYKV